MWLDIVLGAIIVGSLVCGAIKGGIREVFGLLGVVLGILIGAKFYTRLSVLFPISTPVVVKIASFIIIFVVIALAVYLMGFLIYSFMRFLKVGFIDRIFGLILGVLKGSLLAGITCLFILLFPHGNNIVHKSNIAPVVLSELRLLQALFPKELQSKLRWHTPRKPTQSSSWGLTSQR